MKYDTLNTTLSSTTEEKDVEQRKPFTPPQLRLELDLVEGTGDGDWTFTMQGPAS